MNIQTEIKRLPQRWGEMTKSPDLPQSPDLCVSYSLSFQRHTPTASSLWKLSCRTLMHTAVFSMTAFRQFKASSIMTHWTDELYRNSHANMQEPGGTGIPKKELGQDKLSLKLYKAMMCTFENTQMYLLRMKYTIHYLSVIIYSPSCSAENTKEDILRFIQWKSMGVNVWLFNISSLLFCRRKSNRSERTYYGD